MAETEIGYVVNAFGKRTADSKFSAFKILRGPSGENDVEIDIHFCGMSQWDAQFVNDRLGVTNFPCVPGREMTGVVRWVGANVQRFRLGDRVGVGMVVDSCMMCDYCAGSMNHACREGFTMVFNDKCVHGHVSTDTGYTFGGFSERITVNEHFVVKIPDALSLEAASTIINTASNAYAALRRFEFHFTTYKRIAVVGLGNVGQMALKLAAHMKCRATAISATADESDLAFELGAVRYVAWETKDALISLYKSFDLIIDTLDIPHDINIFLPMLAFDGVIVVLGVFFEPHKIRQYPDLMKMNLGITGSVACSTKDVEAMMDLCSSTDINPTFKVITAPELDEVFESLEGVQYNAMRYTLDIRKSLQILLHKKLMPPKVQDPSKFVPPVPPELPEAPPLVQEDLPVESEEGTESREREVESRTPVPKESEPEPEPEPESGSESEAESVPEVPKALRPEHKSTWRSSKSRYEI